MSKRHAVMIAMGLFASASALAQTETTGQAGSSPAASGGTVPAAANPAHAAAPKTAASTSASTPESRSAAALAMTHEPTYDEGSAPRGSVKIPRVWSLETPPPDDRRQRR
ncbi:hypothetical protein ACVMII_007524 [Bradyrhizobium diazoefficiens]